MTAVGWVGVSSRAAFGVAPGAGITCISMDSILFLLQTRRDTVRASADYKVEMRESYQIHFPMELVQEAAPWTSKDDPSQIIVYRAVGGLSISCSLRWAPARFGYHYLLDEFVELAEANQQRFPCSTLKRRAPFPFESLATNPPTSPPYAPAFPSKFHLLPFPHGGQ